MKNKLKYLAIGGMLGLSCLTGKANDIFIGTRGPTELQLDARIAYSQKTDDKGVTTRTTTQNDVLKYWSGDKTGVFGFVNVPAYKYVDNGKSQSEGFGDLVLGLGPRGRIDIDGGKKGSLHFLSYGKITLATADVGTPALGNDRTDFGAGAFLTYLSPKKGFEIDGAVEYNWAGSNSKGVRGKDMLSGGLIAGGRIYDSNVLELRLAGGLNGQLREDGANSIGLREVLRVTPKFKSGKKHGHFEIVADQDIVTRGMPRGYSVMGQFRFNLPWEVK